MALNDDTIVAAATATGGAISIVRLSGGASMDICDTVFRSASGKKISDRKGYSLMYGNIVDGERVIDDVLVSVFRAPQSYTGENMVEISCHGSSYIVSEIIKLLVEHGARSAEPGEFTARAFVAGKFDLSQAEAIADMIASGERASHSIASTQMRGEYSRELNVIRAELLRIVSLVELELDFSEEDVIFADRTQLALLLNKAITRISVLLSSFSLGNAIKEGIGVAIVGNPNAGKSTLLNTLLKDDRAMVSDVAGTTRDIIEEQVNINGVRFRFIDTAGIRHSEDKLEIMGIERAFNAATKANIILYVIDADDINFSGEGIDTVFDTIRKGIGRLGVHDDQQLFIVLNKCDKMPGGVSEDNFPLTGNKHITDYIEKLSASTGYRTIAVSAKYGHNIDEINEALLSYVNTGVVFGGAAIVSNMRHHEALLKSERALLQALANLEKGLSTDLLTHDIRESLYWLGTITGEITTDEILQEIFSNFCIGK